MRKRRDDGQRLERGISPRNRIGDFSACFGLRCGSAGSHPMTKTDLTHG